MAFRFNIYNMVLFIHFFTVSHFSDRNGLPLVPDAVPESVKLTITHIVFMRAFTGT